MAPGGRTSRLLVLHDGPIAVPLAYRKDMVALHGPAGWPTPRRGDLVLWSRPSLGPQIHSLPAHDTLLSTSAILVREARRQDWPRAVLLPDVSPEVLEAALPPDALVDLPGATFAPKRQELWTEGKRHRLPPSATALLMALAESDRPLDPRSLKGPRSLAAWRAVLARLRRRTGHPLVVSDDPRGWRLARIGRPGKPSIAPPAPTLTFGDLSLDPTLRQAIVAGDRVQLSLAEAGFLRTLMDAKGGLVERDAVQKALGGRGPHALDILVHRLRQKVGRRTIRTVRGMGWHLEGPATPPEPEPVATVPLPSDLDAHIANHPLVCVTGNAAPPLVLELARTHRWATFDVREIDRPRVLRWLDRRREARVVLLGLDDPKDWANDLASRASRERGIVVCGAPISHPAFHHVAMGSVGQQIDQGRRAVQALPERERAQLRRLACFEGPFRVEDAAALLHDDEHPPQQVEDLLNHWTGILWRHETSWRMHPGARDSLLDVPVPPHVERTWARRVVEVVRLETQSARCRHSEVVARLPDLARAARWLVATRDPLRVPAMVLWRRCGEWWRGPPFDEMMACLETVHDDEPRAELLLEASLGTGISTDVRMDLARRAEALTQTSQVRWSARLVQANQADSQDPGPERPRCHALLRNADNQEDPAPPDVAAVLAYLGMVGHPLEEQRAGMVRAIARLEEARWGDDTPVEGAWLQQARSASLAHLGNVLARMGRTNEAEAALRTAESDASPMTEGLVRLHRANNLARLDRWPEADRLLVDTLWAPAVQDHPLARLRILGTRAVLAAAHGPATLATVATEQLQWEQERTPHAFVEQLLHQARWWLALRSGEEASTKLHVEGAHLPSSVRAAMNAAAAGQDYPPLGERDEYGIERALERWTRTRPIISDRNM